MDRELFAERVRAIEVGKVVGGVRYLHAREFDACGAHELALLMRAKPTRANVLKLDPAKYRMSFLHYPAFQTDPWPALTYGILADLEKGTLTSRRYSQVNPPILHRKELLWPSHVSAPEWAALTARCERAGCFGETRSIGTRAGWSKRLRECAELPPEAARWLRSERGRVAANAV